MLENKTIKVRNSKNILKINIYYIIFSMLTFATALILIPEFVKYLLAIEDEEAEMLLTFNMIWQRGLPGLAAGIIFSLFGIKKFDPGLRISLIRFFLITFILLVAILYLITR